MHHRKCIGPIVWMKKNNLFRMMSYPVVKLLKSLNILNKHKTIRWNTAVKCFKIYIRNSIKLFKHIRNLISHLSHKFLKCPIGSRGIIECVFLLTPLRFVAITTNFQKQVQSILSWKLLICYNLIWTMQWYLVKQLEILQRKVK